MRRRKFIAMVGAAAWPVVARGQQAGKLPTYRADRGHRMNRAFGREL